MKEISRAHLFGKLNGLAYRAIDAATHHCNTLGNPYVELEHWIAQILQLQDSDLHCAIRQFSLDPSRLAKDVVTGLERLPKRSSSIADFSSHVEEAVERGWVYATLMFGASQVRTGYLLVGMLKTRALRNALIRVSSEFEKLNLDTLSSRFDEIMQASVENGMAATDGFQASAGASLGEADGAMTSAQMGKAQALRQFTVDLTERARNGKIDPVLGRDREIRQIMDILMRRRQNNPILTGEAGVGKTAVVEGFALRIAAGDVPPPLQDVTLRMLDVGLLQAGASRKGEFEQRLKQLIEEVQSSESPIILFIDEAHTLVGAGGSAGTGDAANLLKPALARGSLRTVAATTWAEYKKHIEKDPALTRRFQVVQVDEPEESRALGMVRGVAPMLEAHHRVQVLDEALESAVRLSHRYIPARQLPDKCISLLDTACARVAISHFATPQQVEECQRRIGSLETELAIRRREQTIGIDPAGRDASAERELAEQRERLQALRTRWEREKSLVDEILDLRARLQGEVGAEPCDGESAARETGGGRLERLRGLQEALSQLQGEQPLILLAVDAQAVAAVVADWTGIPLGRMVRDEVETVLGLEELLRRRVIAQDHALAAITRRVQTSRANLDNPTRPIGVFLLAGPSGVGKTETALTLAEALYGGEHNLITINMSEFQEAHTVSTLKGSPPGYVGYGEGGVLTEAVRRKPYSVVLLDEVEKAHPDLHEIFFQVFDKGWMEDGEGRRIDFRNTLIILTSNAGAERIEAVCKDLELLPAMEAVAQALREPLLKVFPAALLGRLVVVPYYPLNRDMLGSIIRLQLGRVQRRIVENHQIGLNYDDAVVELIASRCVEVESGARMVDAILTNTLLPHISRELLTAAMESRTLNRVGIEVRNGEFHYAID